MSRLDFYTLALAMGRPNFLFSSRDGCRDDHPLVEHKFLIETTPAKVAQCPCGNGHAEEVERDVHAGKTMWTLYCSETGELFTIRPDDLRQWKLNSLRLAAELSSCFRCQGAPTEIRSGIWQLGKSEIAVAGFRRQIIFAERMQSHDYAALPPGTTPLLIIGEARPDYSEAWKDRIFALTDLLSMDNDNVKFDMAVITERLGGAIKDEKPEQAQKSGKKALRADRIKELFKEHLTSARAALWNEIDHDRGEKLLPRPTLEQLVARLPLENGKRVVISTVQRTIDDSTDKELQMLWQGCNSIEFVKKFGSRK